MEMSEKEKDKAMSTVIHKESGVGSQFDFFLLACRVVASMMANLPEDDRADMAEVLQEMGQSVEEMEQGEQTIVEIFSPKVGSVIPMVEPGQRPDAVAKWSQHVGGRVRQFRKTNDLTQSELAEKAGLPQSHISRIESGEISPSRITIEKIAKAIGRPISDFDPTED
jgi:DNA-binding XRE family transcriptional regulator